MERSVSLVEGLLKHVDALDKLVGYFDDDILKKSITGTKDYIKSLNNLSTIDLETVAVPFTIAYNSMGSKYTDLIIEFVENIFVYSSPMVYPNKRMTIDVLKILYKEVKESKHDLKLKYIDTLYNVVISYSGRAFIHSHILKELIEYLLTEYNNEIGNNRANEIIQNILNEQLVIIANNYNKQLIIPPKQNLHEYSSEIIDYITEYSFEILTNIPEPNCNATIKDLDLVCAIQAFATIIKQNNLKIQTYGFILQNLDSLLITPLPAYKMDFMKQVLNNDIHYILTEAISIPEIRLSVPIGSLILTLYTSFGPMYRQGLSDVVAIFIQELNSIDDEIVQDAARTIRVLASHPQLFIDLFVNYDCNGEEFLTVLIKSLATVSTPSSDLVNNKQLTCITALAEIFDGLSKLMDKKIKVENHKNIDRNSIKPVLNHLKTKFNVESQILGEFLAKTDKVEPKFIGLILAESNNHVINQFFNELIQKKFSLEKSIETYLNKVTLPNDPIKAEKLLWKFAEYCFPNSIFHSIDSCYDSICETIRSYNQMKYSKKSNDFIHIYLINKGFTENDRKNIINLAKSINISSEQHILFSESIFEVNQFHAKSKLAFSEAALKIVDFQYEENYLLINPIFEILSLEAISSLKQTVSFTVDFYGENKKYCEQVMKMLRAFIHMSANCYQERFLSDLIQYSTNIIKRYWNIGEYNIPNQIISWIIEESPKIINSWHNFIILLNQCRKSTTEAAKFSLPVIKSIVAKTVEFPANPLISFVENLCNFIVSNFDESMINYLLDICLNNSTRPRLIWREIWSRSSNVISKCILDRGISIVSIDYLFDIAKSLIESDLIIKNEDEVLEPLISCVANVNDEIRLHIIVNLSKFTNNFGQKISKGWSVISQIAGLSTIVDNEEISSKALDIVEHVVIDYSNSSKFSTKQIISALSQTLCPKSCQNSRFRAISLVLLVAEKFVDDIESLEALSDAFFNVFEGNDPVIIEVGEAASAQMLSKFVARKDLFEFFASRLKFHIFSRINAEKIQPMLKQYGMSENVICYSW